MAQTEYLPIFKASYDLCLHLEQVVAKFACPQSGAIFAVLLPLVVCIEH